MPRKSDAAAAQNALTLSAQSQQESLMEGIENFELPRALVIRIAKSALPGDIKLQKDAVLALSKGSAVFINYLAATAQDVARSRSVKTISPADVLKAMEIIEFGDQVDLLQKELEAHRGKDSKTKDRRKRPSTSKDQERPPPATRSKVSDASGMANSNGNMRGVGSITEPLPGGEGPAWIQGAEKDGDDDSADQLLLRELDDEDNGPSALRSRPESRQSNVDDDLGYSTNEEPELGSESRQDLDDLPDDEEGYDEDDVDRTGVGEDEMALDEDDLGGEPTKARFPSNQHDEV